MERPQLVRLTVGSGMMIFLAVFFAILASVGVAFMLALFFGLLAALGGS